MVHVTATYACDLCDARASAEGDLDPTNPAPIRGCPMPDGWTRKNNEDLCAECDGAVISAARNAEAASRAQRTKLKEKRK